MRLLKAWYTYVLERLYLRAIQRRYVVGTDPDDGGHGELRWGWNDPMGHNRPLVGVTLSNSKGGFKARLIMSPKQAWLTTNYLREALRDQARKFGYDFTDPPEYDTRYLRVPDES